MELRLRRLRTIAIYLVITLMTALVTVFVAQAEFGTNWTAQYYDNRDLSGDPVETQTGINGINFNWGEDAPIDDVDDNDFSIRFSSTQTFSQGTYEFVVASDDGVRVFIDGALVLDRWVSRPLTTDRFQQTLSAGNHNLVVEYFENEDNASIQFQWFLVSGSINPGFSTPVFVNTPTFGTPFFATPVGPTATPVPTGPQASVTFVRALAIRTGPYLGATYVSRLTRETTYSVLGRNRSEGVYNWYLVQTPDGRQGWASGRYLDLSVDINAIPEVGSVFDQIDNAPDIGVIGMSRTVLNVRTRPSIRAPQVSQLAIGEIVAIIGRTVQANTDQWYQIRRANGEVGWVFAGYMSVRGEINQVPIR